MIFKCPYCDIIIENNDPILESVGGITFCPECKQLIKVDPLAKENK